MALQSAHGRFLIIRNCSDSRRQINLGFSTNSGSVVIKESTKLKWLKLNGNQTKNTSIGELEEKGLTGFGNVVNGSVKDSSIDKVGNGSNGSIGDFKKVSNRSNGSFIDFKKAVNGSNGSFKDFKKVSNRSNGSLKDYKKVINGSNGSVKDYEINMVSNGPNGSLKYFKKIINGSNGSIKESKTDKVVNGSNGSLKDSEIKPREALEKQFNLSNNQEQNVRERLLRVYNEVLVIDNIKEAKRVVKLLTTKYKDFIHGCDTEVAKIDVKQETPVNHGELICFSIYSCNNGIQADFGNEKSCIWVDILDGEKNLLKEFIPFFEDPSIKKVWHNYSFDSHIIENYDITLKGFHADTMHLARLWDSSRRLDGGYSLEALSGDSRVISNNIISPKNALNIGKISMKSIFGKKKIKKDGTEGKIIIMDPVENLQRENRELWISYSSLDSISTLRLYLSLKEKLENMNWVLEGCNMGSMYDFYREYWGPFGEILVKMETQGMLVDRVYLANIEKIAIKEQKLAQEKFKNWASGYCEDAKFMNVGSDAQIRQLFFGGIKNNKNPEETLPLERTFKIPNTDKIIENGKKTPAKTRNITLRNLVQNMQPESFTLSGWPSVSGPALKSLAGPIPPHLIYKSKLETTGDDSTGEDLNGEGWTGEEDLNEEVKYGSALKAFGGGRKGREACCAIAALCEVCSIDSLISNFILPLQGNHISCDKGRIHCSLNINTETGRLSARAPNLQNQPALEKDRYKIRQAFIAAPGNSLIVADYGQLELRILAHLAKCKSMLDAFKAGGDFHSRTAMNMYDHVRKAVEENRVLLEWYPIPGQDKPPVPLLKDAFGSERRKAKMLNFSIAYGKTPMGLARDWKVSVKEAKETVKLWYKERQEVLRWQEKRKRQALETGCVHTLLGRARKFPSLAQCSPAQRGHIERAAINTPVQGSAADVAMCAMIEIDRNKKLKELGWKLLLQVHDEVILEGPTESAELAKSIVVECMSKPFNGANILNVDLSVDAKCAQNWYAAK